MAINFPNLPTLNQIYTYNGISWKWNGSYWEDYSIFNVGIGFNEVEISGITQFTSSTNQFINFSGINISITSGISANTLIFSAGTGGSGGPSITGGTFDSRNLELDLTSSQGTVIISGVTGLYISAGTYASATTTLSLFNSTGGTISITGFSRTFSGGSGNCINQLYLNEIYPCTSDIKIQPLSAGKVFFGSLSGASGFTTDLVSDTIYTTARLGLNNTSPEYTFDFYSRDRKNRFYLLDNITKVNAAYSDPAFGIGQSARLLVLPQSYINDDNLAGKTVTLYNKSGESESRVVNGVIFNSPAGSGTTRINFFGGVWQKEYSENSGGYFLMSTSEGIGDGGLKNVVFSGDPDTNSSYSVVGPNRFGQESFHGINVGIIGYTVTGTALTQVGTTGDSFIRAFGGTNGLNIINPTGTDTDNYIRFYAGQFFINSNGELNTPDIHIQGVGTTRGFVGIGTTGVTNQLHVSASTHPVRFQGLVSSANTRYLVANSDGVVTYTTSSPGGGGTGFSAITINNTSQFNSSSSQVLNFSGINITITSAATNTLVFSAGTGGGGGGGVTSITAGYGVSANTSTGNVTIIQVFDYGKAYTTGNNLNFL
jgi:hypothetical protein